MSIYSYAFKSVILESIKMIQIIISENDTFESAILESVKIESVRVDRQASPTSLFTSKKRGKYVSLARLWNWLYIDRYF